MPHNFASRKAMSLVKVRKVFEFFKQNLKKVLKMGACTPHPIHKISFVGQNGHFWIFWPAKEIFEWMGCMHPFSAFFSNLFLKWSIYFINIRLLAAPLRGGLYFFKLLECTRRGRNARSPDRLTHCEAFWSLNILVVIFKLPALLRGLQKASVTSSGYPLRRNAFCIWL